jgi:hypothetical protein
LAGQVVDGTITLKLILKKWDRKVQTGCSWLRIGFNRRLCEQRINIQIP